MAAKRPPLALTPTTARRQAPRRPEDLAALLVGVEPPRAPAIDAAFFHRTLLRFVGGAEGPPAARGVEWDYDLWKASLARAPDASGREVWEATILRGPTASAERFRYFLVVDGRGRVRKSGWLSEPPALGVRAASGGFEDAGREMFLDEETTWGKKAAPRRGD